MNKIISLKNNDKEKRKAQTRLLQAMGAKDFSTRVKAQEIFAAVAGPIVQQTLNQLATHALVYGEPIEYNPEDGDDPEIVLEYWHDIEEGMIDIWSQGVPGGLPTNVVTGPIDTFRLRTFVQETAVAMKRCFATQSRIDVIESILERVLQEILVKSEYQAWTPILKAVSESRVNGNLNLIDASISGRITLDDVNRLWTKACRVRQSWAGGTPANLPCAGLTDLFLSCEQMQYIRSYSYNPANTIGTPNSDESTAMSLPDEMRMQIFRNSGLQNIFGVNLITLQEFGVGQVWNNLFNSFYSPGGGDPTFNSSTQELALAVDLSCRAFYHCVGRNECEPSPLEFFVDDQFRARDEMIGWYVKLRQGFSVVDAKNISGIII